MQLMKSLEAIEIMLFEKTVSKEQFFQTHEAEMYGRLKGLIWPLFEVCQHVTLNFALV